MQWRKMVSIALMAFLAAAWSWSADSKKDQVAYPDIEFWMVNIGYKPIEKDSPLYKFYKEKFNMGVTQPYVEWNGGTDYLNQLNLRIAAGNMPNVFLPWNGNEAELAKNGAIVDLTDLLPKYAPNLWKLIPESAWKVVMANDPTGKGRIYWIPAVNTYERTSGLIRKDWLDKLGLQIPKTQAEFVAVLKAFRDKDPNGNGKKDELPTGGRAGARWIDQFYNMYGVAAIEGYPEWDIYNGEITYSATTKNAKDALAFMAQLYKDGLMDPETFLNDKAAWDGKIDSNRVGCYDHWAEASWEHAVPMMRNFNIKANIAVLPVLKVPGYEGKGFISTKRVGDPNWVVSSQQDQAHLMACLHFLDVIADSNNWMDMYFAVDGMHSKVVDGKRVIIPIDKSTQQNLIRPWEQWATIDFSAQLYRSAESAETKWAYEDAIANMKGSQQYVKVVAEDGMPASIFADYPDLAVKKATLWQEYATKIIIGAYPISKFDEFVQKWNQAGGAEVTKRVRAWYAKVKAVK